MRPFRGLALRPVEITAAAFCAALYAGLGYMAWLGLVCPVIGVVRFWPVVVVPAVFATLFGPLVGALGAAVGIFISDILIHGDPLLSLLVGVPANFAGFYVVGWLSRREIGPKRTVLTSGLATLALLGAIGASESAGLITSDVGLIFLAVCLVSFFIIVAALVAAPKWSSYHVACTLGLLLGSTIIGLGVWAYSQFFVLPKAVGGGFRLPIWAALWWFTWTFLTEIPFMLVLGPPIVEACLRAHPTLARGARVEQR